MKTPWLTLTRTGVKLTWYFKIYAAIIQPQCLISLEGNKNIARLFEDSFIQLHRFAPPTMWDNNTSKTMNNLPSLYPNPKSYIKMCLHYLPQYKNEPTIFQMYLKWQKPFLGKNYLMCTLAHVSFANMERKGFMTYSTASHQGKIEMFILQFLGAVMSFIFLQSVAAVET